MSVKSKTINLRELHDAACDHGVEVDLGVIKNAKDWLSVEPVLEKDSRLFVEVTHYETVFITIKDSRGDSPIKGLKLNLEEGQSAIDKIFITASLMDRFGDNHFHLEDVKRVFEREYP
jgi:hypothetical protein